MPTPPQPDAAAPGGARVLPADAADYPRGLLDLADPPACLYVRGGALPPVARAIAVVGSRAASPSGVARATRLAGDLARLGFTIVSGLARGIDAAAHRGALDAGGRTVAVIPSGLDAITPSHHLELADEIAVRGALVTECARGGPWGKGAFVERNRLIAAMAAATVVVEAAERSGALTTAAWARSLGRPVLAVPGPVERETARGCHDLIRRGAALCEDAGDVIAAIDVAGAPPSRVPRHGVLRASTPRRRTSARAATRAIPGLEATPEARVLAALGPEPATVDALARAAGLALPETLAALTTLEWAGAAAARPGQRWSVP